MPLVDKRAFGQSVAARGLLLEERSVVARAVYDNVAELPAWLGLDVWEGVPPEAATAAEKAAWLVKRGADDLWGMCAPGMDESEALPDRDGAEFRDVIVFLLSTDVFGSSAELAKKCKEAMGWVDGFVERSQAEQ
ncbi:hypothetical protein TSOC_007688 [Tetrabaena socialis]|uniref:Uncharacterized protein n=1 Tax=Tetrabaena socialis TaxID=47790 RepID=A0A2J8A0F2_9CHLO|nr:hypothetical protein TSOC_007688 [Tetrabaena socialis]|eukprot:PNH06013.1 hypothetical protein TSOC_007688 [Tetrabaena socialis]